MKTLVARLQDRLVAALMRARSAVWRRPPGPRTVARAKFFVHSLFSALFIACLIHAWPALVLPVDLPLRAVIGNVVSWTAAPTTPPGNPPGNPPGAGAPLRDFALIKLDSERFRRTYHGNSPLDRCALLQDLRGLLASSTLQLLAIDLDLSPTTQRALRSKAEDARSCDTQLDQLMIDNVRRVLLILPLDRHRLRAEPGTAEGAERVKQLAWLETMRKAQVRFARPELDTQLGMVRHHVLQPEPALEPEPGLGVATADAICGISGADPSLLGYCQRVQALKKAAPADARQISLHVLVNQLPLDHRLLLDGQTGTVLDDRKIRYAMLGASYSPDDEPLTPIGRLAGVEVHAAIAASPNEAESHVLGFLIDVVVGLGFAYVVLCFWRRYFRQRLAGTVQQISVRGRRRYFKQRLARTVQPINARGQRRYFKQLLARTAQQINALGHPLLAYRWLVGLVISSLLLLPLLGWASAWALAEKGLWISPAAMLVGILIDAFVVGGVHTAEDLLRPAVPAAPDPPDYWHGWQGRYRCLLALLPSLVWLAVLLLAVWRLAH